MPVAEVAVSYGQDSAIRLVRAFVDRPGDGRVPELRKLPVLCFTGPHGIGKTTLVATLESKLQGNIPYARLDCEATQNLTTQEMLTRLALDLNRKCGMYGRLAFPRFATGLIAMKATVSRIPSVAPREMTAALAQARRITQIRQLLGDAAAELPFGNTIPGVKALARLLPGLAIDLLLRLAPARKVLLGRDTAWYDNGNLDAVDMLVMLNTWAQQPDNNRAQVDQLLLGAFLADLRYAFHKARGAARRPLNCVILLDNTHAEAGSEFLRLLTQIRQDDTNPDPLTVVATALPGSGDRSLRAGDPSLPPDGAIEPWLGQQRLTVWLPDLTESQVGEMANSGLSFPGLRPAPHIRRIAYDFTRGHPHSTDIVIGRLRSHDDLPVSDILNDAATELRGDLLNGFPQDYVRLLTTCAAARDLGEMNRLEGLAAKADLDLIHDHWSLLHKSGDSAVMQPVLRRLLLLDLAAREDDALDGWRNVFSWLRDRAGRDEYARLYHTLALGEVEPVVTWLDHHLGDPDDRPEYLDAGPWLEALNIITAAPVRNPPGRSPHKQVDTSWAGQWDSRPARVACLVAGLQLAREPLTSLDRRTLHERIAGAYLGLRGAAPSGREVFEREAKTHQELAREWPAAKDAEQ